MHLDTYQHGILLSHPAWQVHPTASFWGAPCIGTAAHKGQVLELCLLQVHLCIWSYKCAVHG